MATTAERTAVPSAVTTPSAIVTPMGILELTDGYPAAETAEKLRGWFTILRLYSPLQPFFDKTWRTGEIELAT